MDLEIRPSKDDLGRRCYRIFVDGRATNAYAYSEGKAQELLNRQLKALGQAPQQARTAKAQAPKTRPKPARPASIRTIQGPSVILPTVSSGKFPAGGVMLAKKWEEGSADPKGYWMSEKLEGIRGYWTGSEMISRNRKPIAVPDWFRQALPPVALDGELFLTRGEEGFQALLSIVNKSTARDPRWRNVKYMVFDAPEAAGPCEARWEALKTLVAESHRKHKNSPLVYVEQLRCRSQAHLDEVFKEITDPRLKGEGVILRKAGSPYLQKRSSYMLKYKVEEDAEAVIIGYEQGKTSGAELGSYVARLLDTGVEFKFDARHLGGRRRAGKLSKGTVVTVRYQRKSTEGTPINPRLIAVRDYE